MHQWRLLHISHLRDYKLLFTQLWLTLGSKPTKQRRQINKDLLGIKLSDKNFFYKMTSDGIYSLIYSQLTVLNNYLCALDTTLRILITKYKLHIMNYINFF